MKTQNVILRVSATNDGECFINYDYINFHTKDPDIRHKALSELKLWLDGEVEKAWQEKRKQHNQRMVRLSDKVRFKG